MLPTTDVGPLATPSILSDLERQVEDLVKSGATLLTGGKRIEGSGNFFQPTVITDIDTSSPIYYEELFGPVAMLFVVRDVEEAIKLANRTPFGLGASVWTNDARERDQFINEIESGMVFVNGMVASDPRLPFGGVKETGNGHREGGPTVIDAFTEWKSVYIDFSGRLQKAQIDR